MRSDVMNHVGSKNVNANALLYIIIIIYIIYISLSYNRSNIYIIYLI